MAGGEKMFVNVFERKCGIGKETCLSIIWIMEIFYATNRAAGKSYLVFGLEEKLHSLFAYLADESP